MGNNGKEIRQIYQDVLQELMDKDPSVVMLDADLASASGSSKTFNSYPQQTINVGISEANMAGVGAGLSYVGMKPYAHTFAPFIARKMVDQIYMSLSYAQGSLHLYGSDPGFWAQANGGTHTTYEDIGIMKAIPGVVVVAPSDPSSFEWVLRYYYQHGGVIYNRAPRKLLNQLYDQDEMFALGKAKMLKKGSGVALIGVGEMTQDALQAQEILKNEGIQVTVVDLISIKPFDKNMIESLFENHKHIVVCENHNISSGVGEMIGSFMAEKGSHCTLHHIANNEQFGEVGEVQYLKEQKGLTVNDIVACVKKIY